MTLLRGLIDAVRDLTHLKHSTYHGCLQLAVLARGPHAEVQISHQGLATMCHFSIRTAYRVTEALEQLGIVVVIRDKTANSPLHAKNVYRFLLPWDRQAPARMWGTAKKRIASFFGREHGKMTSGTDNPDPPKDPVEALQEALANQEKILRCYHDQGSRLAQWTRDEIARLRGLLEAAERPAAVDHA
jgi:hypothetical protein